MKNHLIRLIPPLFKFTLNIKIEIGKKIEVDIIKKYSKI